MGEPTIPSAEERELAVTQAREILQAIREDVAIPLHPIMNVRRQLAQLLDVGAATTSAARDTLNRIELRLWRLAAAVDLMNSLIGVIHSVAISNVPGDTDMIRLAAIKGLLRQAEFPGVRVCEQCGIRPATCEGLYIGGRCDGEHQCAGKLELCSDTPDQPACDECCGHGNDNEHCHPIDHPAIVDEVEA